jgi:hypothetical protein
MGAGQFSIFGAVEEKKATDFRGLTRIEQRLTDGWFRRWMAVVLA